MTVLASLWMVDADAVIETALQRYRNWLTPGEMARHQRFVRVERQRQFTVGRALLRTMLGQVLNVIPQDVQLEEQAGKAPRLAAPILNNKQPGFSISHSGRWVACAVSAQTMLGLDIERRDASRDLPALAAQVFDIDIDEADDIRSEDFYRLWSEKEARFKLNQANDQNGHCVALTHSELSVVVCSAQPLTHVPQIEIVTLA